MSLADRFFVTAILFALTGMVFGIWMGITEAFSYAPVHTHALIGAIIMVLGIVGVVVPQPTLELVIIPGSLLTVLAMLIFLVIVLRNRSA